MELSGASGPQEISGRHLAKARVRDLEKGGLLTPAQAATALTELGRNSQASIVLPRTHAPQGGPVRLQVAKAVEEAAQLLQNTQPSGQALTFFADGISGRWQSLDRISANQWLVQGNHVQVSYRDEFGQSQTSTVKSMDELCQLHNQVAQLQAQRPSQEAFRTTADRLVQP